ncbi:glycosyltransferase family 4 protein [Robertkochia sediminum]|uniref:glycosyltransferase family 4 protein n=1 Tax=Robertkochia sediminum TaxID=2785326 RepID=UPI001931D3AA|nr:glycosyltransferase family 4 protein [Robertkochia sediminum]MBL7473740.1 glycosyltransferase family 4 protein [Robertkochia sediminum]
MKNNRTKIFISAYACEPGLGSEIGVGWNWVLQMSRYFDLWVLTRKSNQDTIETWLFENPLENPPQFIYYDLPKSLRFWKKGLRGVRTYYVLWQKLTNSLVKKTMKENDIEIYHLLTYGNALWPVSSYGRKQFFIWGPTGVGDQIPKDFSSQYDRKWRVIERIRRGLAKSLKYNLGYKNRCHHADLILCKTRRTKESIPSKHQGKAEVCTDVAVELQDACTLSGKVTFDKKVKYLAVGRLDPWRGFDLIIEAFKEVVAYSSDVHLEILGKGSDQQRLEALIAKHGLQDHVTLTGQVAMEAYKQKLAESDVILNPALKEGAVTVSFDSMAFKKPLICVDTGGYTRYFENGEGIVLSMSSRDELVKNFSSSMIKLLDEELRCGIGENAYQAGLNYSWDHKGKEIAALISRAVAANLRN